MACRDLAAQNQADTCAFGLGRVEGNEQILRVADAGTLIDNLEFTLALVQPAAQSNGGSALGIGLHGILDQVDQRLFEVNRVAEHGALRKGRDLESLAGEEAL